MTVEELVPYLKENWPRIREELLRGVYRPIPVRRVEIPKPNGEGKRPLGIPTVLDRLIQQAILQVLSPIFDPHFKLLSAVRSEDCFRRTGRMDTAEVALYPVAAMEEAKDQS
jgi:retron-type reverse transcriptase